MPFAAALSTAYDTQQALGEACSHALDRFPGERPELAVAFFSPHHATAPRELAAALHGRLRARRLIGCIAEAVVGNGREVEHQPALSVWLAGWNGAVQIDAFHLRAELTPDGPTLFGWPDALLETDPRRAAMLVLGDPFTFPVTDLFLPRLAEDLPGLPVIGGMASGAAGPGQTVLLRDDEALDQGAVGVLLRGPHLWRSIVSQGCRPIGRPLVVTKGAENVIAELAGQTPLEYLQALYQELSPRDQALLTTGLHIGLVTSEYRESFGRGDFLVRNLLGIDRESGALVIADHVRVGQTVQFQVRDAATADEDLRALLRSARAGEAKPAGGLLFTCNGRGTRMFPGPDHDAGVIQEELGVLPVAGMFAAGELGPVGGANFIHGFTASVVLFEEASGEKK
ncbi:MAG TPA: FIST N-terminal domain-containing protein [Gemmataceae bacterium]